MSKNKTISLYINKINLIYARMHNDKPYPAPLFTIGTKLMFELHPQLQQDCLEIGRFSLCRLLLMNESRYPWFILVPEREKLTEIYQMNTADQTLLMQESSRLAHGLAEAFAADKLNIAAIGNLVPQLHVHHVVRYRSDPAWPAPVWGKFSPAPYDETEIAKVIARLKSVLPEAFEWSSA